MTKNKLINESKLSKIFDKFNIIILCLLMIATFYPILYILFASISKPSDFMSFTGVLLKPLGFSLESFKEVFRNPNIYTGYANTLLIVTFGLAINMFMTCLGAYFLSRKNVMLKNFITFFIVFTMYFNGGIIPMYFTVKWLHIDNSLFSVILPFAISTYNLIIMRTAFATIPPSLEESAKIDGAGHYTILFRILIPIAMPTVAVLLLFYGVYHWNSWFYASIFINDRSKFPLQLILREILIQNDTSSMTTGADTSDRNMIAETIKYAVIVVATLPVLSIYPFLQRYFIKGIMIGAIKE